MSLLEQVSIHAFIQNNGIKTEQGIPLDFSKYKFMFDIYSDRSNFICCMKCAQIGFTTYEILKTAHECYYEGIDIAYVLPTSEDVKTFSGGKTNKILGQNPVMQKWTKDKDSIEQKQFGDHTVYYRGSWTDRVALSFTAQKLVIDEYDRCRQDVVETYDSRLQSVSNPKKAFFSNPSLPEFGIHKWYLQSDQKKWHVKHSCGKAFIMDESCINYDKEMYECPFCKSEITDEERREGFWQATTTGEWSGYWIPLWIAPWMSAKNISKMKKEKTPEFFANFVAGLPYVGSGNKVNREDILKNIKDEVNLQEERIIIGVDTGLPIHYVIGNKQGIFYYGTCDNYDVLEGYLKRWPKSIIVSDQGGDLIGIRQLQQKYPSRVFLCFYRQDRKTQEIIRWGEGDKFGEVVVDRNRGLQILVDEIRDTRIVFNGKPSDYYEYITHWMNIYRIKEENALGVMEYKWERNGPDHWVHSTFYWRIGMDKFADSMAIIVNNKSLQGIEKGFTDITGNTLLGGYYKPDL